ncbi:MAG: hypothetical protein K8L99_02790 [Anaerolineae bacterium]|nr:hypothetical protein [Anaerolineae bacterium]
MVDYVTTVRVLLKESRAPLANVRVALFDRDEHSDDDQLGEGRTNQFGEVTFKYNTRDFADGVSGQDDGFKLRDGDTVPDLYPVIYDSNGEVVVCKRDEATINKASLHILLLVDQELAATHGLLVSE